MAEYIDREPLLMKLKHTSINTQTTFINTVLAGLLNNAPVADVVEVRHGEWRKTQAYPHWLCCSVCDKRYIPNGEWIKAYDMPTNFCPNCGAKMDGKGESE